MTSRAYRDEHRGCCLSSELKFHSLKANMTDGMAEPARPTEERPMPHLPPELFQKIINELADAHQQATLAKLMLASRGVHDIVGAILYRELVVTRHNSRSIFRGLPTAPARISRQKGKGKVDRGITWAEFKHPNHYLDWAASIDWGHNENLRRKRLYTVWPDDDADSDDSDAEGEQEEAERWSEGSAYPTTSSFSRKMSLLSRVERLHFEQLPPWDICRSLQQLARSRRLPVMQSLECVSLRPRAVWKLIDWTDRHRGHQHPFLYYLQRLQASHLCVQMPVIDHHLEKSYMSTRIVPLDEHASRSDALDQLSYLRRELRRLVARQYGPVLQTIKGEDDNWLFQSITVHNFVSQLPFELAEQTCRIFYRPCSCLDRSVTDKVDDFFCYNHFSTTSHARIRPLELMTIKSESAVKKVELIDLDWIAGRRDATRDQAAHDGLDGAIEATEGTKKEYLESVVRLVRSSEAEPCVCCGHRQLSGKEVSLGVTENNIVGEADLLQSSIKAR